MRIAILIPSRNRPRLLSSVITILQQLASGEHEIEYRIGHDSDDHLTQEMVQENFSLPSVRAFGFSEEVLTIGRIWNALAKENADIYSCLIDDAFPISPHWDKEMVVLASQHQAFSWYEVSAPYNCGYPTCTKEWLNKVGYIVPEHFPFWFCDTWYQEMVNFITGSPVPISTQMSLYSKQEATQNLRDLDFWWGFFSATRKIRLREAFSKLNCPWEEFLATRKQFVDAGNMRDNQFKGGRISELEYARGVKGDPSKKYLLAKKSAEEYLEKNGLIIWQ